MPNLSEKKYFLSNIIGASVYYLDDIVGYITDLTLVLNEKYPKFIEILILGKDGINRFATLKQFKNFDRRELNVPVSELLLADKLSNAVFIQSILDKQIVDVSDARVVRVNDIQIAEVENELYFIGIDVGIRGLMRRVGLERWLCPLFEKINFKVESDIIAWDLIENLPANFSQLKLIVPTLKIRDLHPADLADILEDLSASKGLSFIKTLNNKVAAKALAKTKSKTKIIKQMTSKYVSDILETMKLNEVTGILKNLDDEKFVKVLSYMKQKEIEKIEKVLKHDKNTAGSLMNTGFTTVFDDFTVSDALSHLKFFAHDLEIIYYLYVVDRAENVKGVVSIKSLLFEQPNTRIAEIMTEELISVTPETLQEEAINLISKYNLLALPVIDENKILGVITVDDTVKLLTKNIPKTQKRRMPINRERKK